MSTSDPGAHQHSPERSALLETLLDLDAQVHDGLLDDALNAVAGHISRPDEVRRALDVGAGIGAATFRLSDRYTEAEVIALDANRARTRQIAAHAARDQNDRVRTLNRPMLATGLEARSVDLAWGSSVLHEFDDPGRTLAVLSELIRPGGVLAIMEMDGPPRVLPDHYHDLELRLRRMAHADAPLPDWTNRIRAAGFELLEKCTLSGDQELAGDGPGGTYARAELHRLALHAAHGLDVDEQAALSRILDVRPGPPHLPRVHIRGTRSLWIARRP